jgi:hypothetical protein
LGGHLKTLTVKNTRPGLLVLKERPESMLNTALWPKSSGAPSELNCSYFIIPGVPLRSTPG